MTLIMKVECRFCDGNGKIHSPGCNGDPDDSGVDCPECEGTGAVDADCANGDEFRPCPGCYTAAECRDASRCFARS